MVIVKINKKYYSLQPITSTARARAAHRDHLPSLVRTAEDSTYHSGLNCSESCHFITLLVYQVYVNHFFKPGTKTVVTASRSKTVVWTHQDGYMTISMVCNCLTKFHTLNYILHARFKSLLRCPSLTISVSRYIICALLFLYCSAH